MDVNDLFLMLLVDNPSDIIRTFETKLFYLIPELKLCKGFNQNNEWHIYDVYEHILHVVDNVPRDLTLRLAALFHDVGKPFCYCEDENGVGHFYGHYEISKKIFDKFSDDNFIDSKLKYMVSNLIFYHDINVSKLGEDSLNEFYKIFGSDGIKKLYELKKADLLAQNEKYHYILSDYEIQKEKILSKFC